MEGIINAKDLDRSNLKIHALLSGPPKSGKRRISCSFPKVFVADFDGGMDAVVGRDVSYKKYNDTMTLTADLNELCQNPNPPFATFVLSSLTSLQYCLMRETAELNSRSHIDKNNPFRNNLIVKTGITIGDWGVMINWIKNFVIQFKNITTMNTIIITHEEVTKVELTGSIRRRPLVMGKDLPDELGAFPGEVWRTAIGHDQKGLSTYNIITTGDDDVVGGSRLDCLPRVLDVTERAGSQTAYELIMDYVEGRKKR